MNRLISLMLILCLVLGLVPACTVPDPNDENWETVKNAVHAITPEQMEYSRRYTLGAKFEAWYKKQLREWKLRSGVKQPSVGQKEEEEFRNKTFLSVECSDEEHTIKLGYTLDEFANCILNKGVLGSKPSIPNMGWPSWRFTLDECIKGFVRHSRDLLERDSNWDDDTLNCGSPKIELEFQTILDEKLNEEFTDEDLTRILVSSPMVPEWAQFLGIVVAGGIVVIKTVGLAVALCALGADWGCPAAPSGPRPTAPNPAPSGDWSTK